MNDGYGGERQNAFGGSGTGTMTVEKSNEFLGTVFSWMTAGLLITGLLGWYVAQNMDLMRALFSIFWVLVIAELGLVWTLSGRINRLSASAATGLFLGYSALSGLTFSTIFLVYSMQSIVYVFAVTATLFAVLAVFGRTTRMDLTKIGTIAFAGLIAILIVMVLNMFLFKSGPLDQVISILGVIIFSALTAYDMQKLTQMAQTGFGDRENEGRMAILGALDLYLDFVNLFLFLLRLMGGRRN